LIVVVVEQLLDDDVDDRQRDSEADGVLVGVNVHVHRVCMLDLVVEVRLLIVNKKLIVLLPCLGMLLQVQQIVLFDEWHFEDMNIVGQLALATHWPNISAAIHVEQTTHTRHDQCIAFLFELNNLKAKL